MLNKITHFMKNNYVFQNKKKNKRSEKSDIVLHVHKSLTYLLLHLICSNITLNTAFGKLCGKTMRE